MAQGSVESLSISIGLDLKDALDGLRNLMGNVDGFLGKLTGADPQIKGFGNQITRSAEDATASIKATGREALAMGNKAQIGAQNASQAFRQMDSVANTVMGNIRKYCAPLVAMFGAKKMFNDYVHGVDQLNSVADFVKMNINDLDAWAKANATAGGSAQTFQMEMERWVRSTGKSGQEFIKLGNSLRNMSDERVRAIMKENRLTKDSIAIFMESKESADALVASYKETAFTEEDAENARKFRISWQNLSIAVQSVSKIFMQEVAPVITKILDSLGKGIRMLSQHKTFVLSAGKLIATFFAGRFLWSCLKAVTGLKAIGKATGAVSLAFKRLGFASLLNPIGAVVAGLLLLALAFDDLKTFAEGGNSTIERTMKSLNYSQEEIERSRKNINDLGKSWDDFTKVFKPIGNWIAELCKNEIQLLLLKLSLVSVAITEVVNGFKEWKETATQKIAEIQQSFEDFKKNLQEKFIEPVKKWFEDLFDFDKYFKQFEGWLKKDHPEIHAILYGENKKINGQDSGKFSHDLANKMDELFANGQVPAEYIKESIKGQVSFGTTINQTNNFNGNGASPEDAKALGKATNTAVDKGNDYIQTELSGLGF